MSVLLSMIALGDCPRGGRLMDPLGMSGSGHGRPGRPPSAGSGRSSKRRNRPLEVGHRLLDLVGGVLLSDVSLRAKLPQLALDRIRGDYGAVVGERFMVGLNEAQFVEV